MTSIQAGLSTAKNKYGWLLLIGVALTIADGVFTVTNGALGVFGISMLVGFAATLLYEGFKCLAEPFSTKQFKEEVGNLRNNDGTSGTGSDEGLYDRSSSII